MGGGAKDILQQWEREMLQEAEGAGAEEKRLRVATHGAPISAAAPVRDSKLLAWCVERALPFTQPAGILRQCSLQLSMSGCPPSPRAHSALCDVALDM